MKVKFIDKWWINPFLRVSGWSALWIGLSIMTAATWLAWKGGVVFDTIFSVHFYPATLGTAFLCQLANWLILALLMYLSARVFSTSKARLIDALGAMALAEAPFLLTGLYMAFPAVKAKLSGLYAIAMTGNLSMLATPVLIVFLILTVIAIVWFVGLAYNGFKAMGNIRFPRVIPVFAGTLILAELLATILFFCVFRQMMHDSTEKALTPETPIEQFAAEGEAVGPDEALYAWTENAVRLFCDGRYEEFYGLFDDTMKQSLSVNQIAALVARLNASIGKPYKFDTTFIKQVYDSYDIVFVPLIFEKQELTMQLAFDNEGRISGLYIRPPLLRGE